MGRIKQVKNKFDFLGELNKRFPDNEKPILVGGAAVELYSRGIAKSVDLDLIADRTKIIPVLREMGFHQAGRHFYKGRIFVEIPGQVFEGRTQIILYKGQKIRISSVEDLIVDRSCACKYWKSQYDCEQAQMLFRAYKPHLDMQYLSERAIKEKVEDLIKDMEKS